MPSFIFCIKVQVNYIIKLCKFPNVEKVNIFVDFWDVFGSNRIGRMYVTPKYLYI